MRVSRFSFEQQRRDALPLLAGLWRQVLRHRRQPDLGMHAIGQVGRPQRPVRRAGEGTDVRRQWLGASSAHPLPLNFS